MNLEEIIEKILKEIKKIELVVTEIELYQKKVTIMSLRDKRA